MNDGDWICSDPNCGNINFARRVSCYRCNKERPDGGKPLKKKLGTEIGKSAAEKSRGLFNADDWQCNKCANVNWARRQTCNVCNAPKFGEVEARTGYGGGYNERGVVEYRRREPSSDDEYDEFGRKKRKRKPDTEKVGITEGAVFKKLPPTMLQKETKEIKLPNPTMTLAFLKKEPEKTNGSLSDGSICELPSLNKVAFRRHQVQSQTNYIRQDNMLPIYKSNGQSRKRFSSSGDKDHTGSSGYETGSKKGKRDSMEPTVIKSYNPVMENRVSSTNNDVVYKFSGSTPAEDFQVTYTIEERVKAAAFAIAYNNCRISTDRFESMFDKPAPDFKTIFAWRQRLLTTGCLVDTHLEQKKQETVETTPPASNVPPKSTQELNLKNKPVLKLPNPDEIPIVSDSDDDIQSTHIKNNILPSSRQRSVSAETLLLVGTENDTRAPGSSISTVDDHGSQSRSRSTSTHHRTRSSSRDSQDSNYPDTDSEKLTAKPSSNRSASSNKISLPNRQSVQGSDSDSVSYNSEEDNFLSRVFGEGRKLRRKLKRRPAATVPTANAPTAKIYSPNDVAPYQGYNTLKQMEKSPLATGNIYTTNLPNMNVKRHETTFVDVDGCSSEYVPTRLGATAKKNYQEFKDNVRKKGFWAKGNGASISNKQVMASKPIIKKVEEPIQRPLQAYTTVVNTHGYLSAKAPSVQGREDFTKDDFDNFVCVDPYKPISNIQPQQNLHPNITPEKPQENTSSIFDAVQSNSATKNRSIMDIFGGNDDNHNSPERVDLEKYDNVRKMYETEWDEDDDALYKNTESVDTVTKYRTSSPPSLASVRAQSPLTNMLYGTDNEAPQHSTPKKVNLDVVREKHDMLLDLLKDFQSNREKETNDVPGSNQNAVVASQAQVVEKNDQTFQQGAEPTKPTNLAPFLTPEAIPIELSREIVCMSEQQPQTNYIPQDNISKKISPSKRVHVLESITIPPVVNKKPAPLHEPSDNVELPVDTPQIASSDLQTNVPLQNNNQTEPAEKPVAINPPVPQVDLSNLLAGINTNTLLLALQNLQQLTQNPSTDGNQENEPADNEQNTDDDVQHVETINLTNDEEWEKESNRDGSIERELEKLDGKTSDTPFLSDIFDPGPVIIPPSVAKKLNINLRDHRNDPHKPHINENAPVIGNFKSFALPKPILLNRLKLTVKGTEKPPKKSEGKKKRKKKGKASGSQGEGEGDEDDEEESGDEADLSKYDLWGSDEEQGNSKGDTVEKPKDGETSKDANSVSGDENGRSQSPDTKSSKRRSRSSSSSSSSSTSSSSSHSSTAPKNKFDDFNLNSERESSPKGRKSRSRSRSPRSRSGGPTRRKSRDSRSAGESRSSRDKERSRDRERRDKSRGTREERKERRYSRDGPGNHYSARGRHR